MSALSGGNGPDHERNDVAFEIVGLVPSAEQSPWLFWSLL